MFNVRTDRIEDSSVLDVLMDEVEGAIKAPGGVERLSRGDAVAYLIDNHADNSLATFRFAYPELVLSAAEEAFEYGGIAFNAGAFILQTGQNPGWPMISPRPGSTTVSWPTPSTSCPRFPCIKSAYRRSR